MSPPSVSIEDLRLFAREHGLTIEQARTLHECEGIDRTKLEKAARNIAHFLKAPS